MNGGRNQKVWLNGVDLITVHPAILLQQINEGDLKLNQRWMDRASGFQMLSVDAPQRKEIVIEFAIRDGRDFARRAEAYSAVCAWAYGGGWLEVSDRPGQKIRVACAQMPALGNLRDWTENISIRFIAGWYPFWENTAPIMANLQNVTSGSVMIAVPGNARSNLAATIVPSANIDSITLGVEETNTEITIATTITAGSNVHLRYTDEHFLCIDADGTDLLRWRTGSDDLILNPGTATIDYAFSGACNVTLIAGGAWM